VDISVKAHTLPRIDLCGVGNGLVWLLYTASSVELGNLPVENVIRSSLGAKKVVKKGAPGERMGRSKNKFLME
jgi:hypothetical protein